MVENRKCPQCGAEIPGDAPLGICPQCLMLAGMADPHDAGAANDSGHLHATASHAGGFVPPNPESLAKHFPQLEILEPLGHGGMGAVYKARQVKLDRFVALKIIRPESAGDPAFAERFNREARTLARLNHPHIVAVHDFGEMTMTDSADEGEENLARYYFVMEYVDGANLRRLIQSGELQPEQALTIVPQICEALQFAHEEGIVHRDIKPENVLVDQRGRVKIADFGLAKLASRSEQDFTLTGTNQVMGTPRYMAPEQMEGSHAVDHRADIYSLGVVFYEMLTGRVPAGHFDPPSKMAPVDERLDRVVLRAMAHEPNDRYQQASEISSHVHQIQNQLADSRGGTANQPDATPAGPSTLIDRAVGKALHAAKPSTVGQMLSNPCTPAIIAILLCIGGIASLFVPWGRSYQVENGWFHAYNDVRGILYGIAVLGLGLTIFATTASNRRPVWRPALLLICGAALLILAAAFYEAVLMQQYVEADGSFLAALGLSVALMLVGAWDLRCLLFERQTSGARQSQGVDAEQPHYPVENHYQRHNAARLRASRNDSLLRTLLQFAVMIAVMVIGCVILYLTMTTTTTVNNSESPAPIVSGGDYSTPTPRESNSSEPNLHQAAAAGQIGRVRQILGDGGTDINDKDSAGKTALMHAAEKGQVSTVKAIVLLGGDVNARDNNRMTPTMYAAQNGHANVIDSFFELMNVIGLVRLELSSLNDEGSIGASIDQPDEGVNDEDSRRSSVDGSQSRTDARTLLRDRLSGVDLGLFEDAHFRLPEFDVDTSAQDVLGQTAMMKAAINGHADCIRNLRPWDTCTLTDREGRTAVMHAVLNQQAQFLRDVIAAPSSGTGTSVGNFRHNALVSPKALSVEDRQGRTPLQLAEELEETEIAKILRDELQRGIEHFDRAIAAEVEYEYMAWEYRGYAYLALGETGKGNADLAESHRREALLMKRMREKEESDANDVGDNCSAAVHRGRRKESVTA